MNIFILDLDIKKCAEYHCDPHCSKLILETAQILSTVLRVNNINYGYKEFNKNHPCVIWAGQSISNFIWLKNLGIELGKEFEHRYNNTHSSINIIKKSPNPNIDDFGLTEFVKAMPDDRKVGSVVDAYRNYYRKEKFDKGIIKYTNREPPKWLNMKFKVSMNKNNVVYKAVEYSYNNVYEWEL